MIFTLKLRVDGVVFSRLKGEKQMVCRVWLLKFRDWGKRTRKAQELGGKPGRVLPDKAGEARGTRL